MKKIFIILFILNLTSCSSLKIITTETDYAKLKIAKKTKIYNSATKNYNELRFYRKNIDSAYDTMKLMYLSFGNWNSQEKSMYMPNTNRKVWNNIDLFKNNETFTIIADGTETKEDYFACLSILDSKGNDCLKDEHPLKSEVITLFFNKMKETREINNKMDFDTRRSLNYKLWHKK
jgi:hypothetical protein